jgi:hypothetical protein
MEPSQTLFVWPDDLSILFERCRTALLRAEHEYERQRDVRSLFVEERIEAEHVCALEAASGA